MTSFPPLRRLKSVAVGAALIALGSALDGGAALSQAVSAGGQVTDEVKQFCANIADAARDRRYTIQTAELDKLRKEVDQRIALLDQKRAEYKSWMQRRTDFMEKATASVVDIYARMKPDAAAERLAAVEPDLAAAILMKLTTRQAGVILNEMKSPQAAALTGIMSAAARPEDPS